MKETIPMSEVKRLHLGYATPVALLAVYVYWLWAWQTPLLRADDYLFASRSGLANGQFYFADVASEAWRYVLQVNGRLSDALTQMLMSSMTLSAIVIAALHVVCAYITFAWLNRLTQTTAHAIRFGNLLLACAAPFLLTAFDPLLSGEVYHFIAGSISTLGGYACALLTFWFATNAQEQGRIGRDFWYAIAIFVALGMMHEISAFFLIVALPVLMLTRKPLVHTGNRLVLLPVVALVALRLMTPGMWRRVGVVNHNFFGEHAQLGQYDRIIVGFTRFFAHPVPLIVLFVAVLWVSVVFLSYWRGSLRGSWMALAAIFLLVVAWVVVGKRVYRRLITPMPEGQLGVHMLAHSKSGVALFAIMVLVFLSTVWLLVQQARLIDSSLYSCFFAGAAFVAIIPLSLGNAYGRQMYLMEAILLLLICAMLGYLVKEGAARLRVVGSGFVLICASSLLASSGVYSLALLRTCEDYSQILTQVESVRNQGAGEIVFGGQFRHPYFFNPYEIFNDHMEHTLPLYYGLPSNTVVRLP